MNPSVPLILCFFSFFLWITPLLAEKDLRIGMIGLDTSHVVAFTKVLNDPHHPDHVSGARVVAAFRGGSPDLTASSSRIDGFTQTLTKDYGIEICPSIEELCTKVDAIMLESVDGRAHLKQAQPVIAAGLPLFIDKPMAGSLEDCLRIFELAKQARVPVFSSSSLRYAKETQAVRQGSIGQITYALCSSPASIEPTHPDLFWYGIHGCESLFTVMGTGCQEVTRRTTKDGLIEVTGHWGQGRIGVFREATSYSGIAKNREGKSAQVGSYDGYAPLLKEVVGFFQSGVPPVSPEETIELFAFMEAADQSKRLGGASVSLHTILKKGKNDR